MARDDAISNFFPTFLFALPIVAADFCAVKVSVVDQAAKPVATAIQLIDPSGRVVERVYARTGEAEFCDFGFGPHSIRVGDERCGGVTLDRIGLRRGQTQRFNVILQDCTIAIDGGRCPLSCEIYLRVSSDNGEKLKESEVSIEGNPLIIHVDSYGRIWLSILKGSSENLRITAPGYQEKTLHLFCKDKETLQEMVQLTPK